MSKSPTRKLRAAVLIGAGLVFGLSCSLLAVLIVRLLAMWRWL